MSTTYATSSSRSVQTYQYTSHANDVVIPRALPAIYFRYDFSPVTIRVAKVHQPLAHFLVDLCAIVGGVATVMKLIHSMARSMEARPQHKGMGGATDMTSTAPPSGYGGLTVQTPQVVNGYGSGLGEGRSTVTPVMSPVMSPEVRAYTHTSPLGSSSPSMQRQGSAPAASLGWDRQGSNGVYESARGNGSAHTQPVHRQQVHAAPAKPYGGHDD